MSDERLIRIEEKLDKVLEQQGEMKTVQAEQAVDLKHHIKRTDLLEKQVAGLQKYVYMGLGLAIAAGALLKTIL